MRKNMKYSSKKGNMVGFAIIGLAFLLLLGSLTTSDNSSSSSGGGSSGSGSNNNNNNNGISNVDLENSILFQINDTTLGKEVIDISNYPNMKIGSSKDYEQIYYRNNVVIKDSAFSENRLHIEIEDKITNSDDFLGLLVMGYPINGVFTSPIGLYINNNLYTSENKASNMPIFINRNDLNKTSNVITLATQNIEWYQIGKENRQEFSEIIIQAVSKNSLYSSRTIEFLTNTDKEHLNTLRLKLSVKCPPGEDGSTPIEGYVNGFKVLSQNPTCASANARGTVLSATVPITILKNSEDDEKNSLFLETFGTYETSLQIEEVSFNDEYTYTFYLNNNNDLYDVILFADFDREFLDIQINSYRFEIPRKQTVSIKNKLRSSQNVLTIHEIPTEIKQFTIEQINER